jgi:hypothetical protein
MKKSIVKKTMKWRIIMKMNNKAVEHTPIIAYAWRNNEVVYFISTCYQRREISIVQRKSGLSKIDILALPIVKIYYLSMIEVDITDQLRFSYLI